jgi:hypothetical protein
MCQINWFRWVKSRVTADSIVVTSKKVQVDTKKFGLIG